MPLEYIHTSAVPILNPLASQNNTIYVVGRYNLAS